MSSDTTIETTFETAYDALHNGAVCIDRSELGMLLLQGETRFDLINRMSTQKITPMQSREGKATVFTTDIGRIVDRVILYATSKQIYALTSENNAAHMAQYLMRYVFFMDDFEVQDLSADMAIFGVYGAQAQAFLAPIYEADIDFPLHHWQQYIIDGSATYLHRTDAIAGDGYFVICEAKDGAMMWQKLTNAGIVPITAAQFEYFRIEQGMPRFNHELTAEYNPLELNLWDDVSFAKGCYIGQEIIARMESRGRIAKKLVRFTSATPVEQGAVITVHGKKVGSVTSAASQPNGTTVVLGFVKTAVLNTTEQSSEITAGDVLLTRTD